MAVGNLHPASEFPMEYLMPSRQASKVCFKKERQSASLVKISNMITNSIEKTSWESKEI